VVPVVDLTESPPTSTARLPAVLPVAGAAALVALLAGMWLLTGPALLLLAACVVAGYGLTHFSGLPLTIEERFAYGTVVGAMAVTMAAFLLAIAFGFGVASVAIGAGLAVAAGALGAFIGRARHSTELDDLRARWLAPARTRGHPWPLALLLVICWPYTLKLFSQAYEFRDGALYAGYLNIWGDWAAHLTYTSSFAYGNNFPPQFTIDPGHNLGYPFMADFLAAGLTTVGTSLTSSLVLSSSLLSLAFPAVMYLAAQRLTGSRAAAFTAVFVLALAGGLGAFIFLPGDIDKLGLGALQHLPREYTLDRSQNYQLLDAVLAYLLPQRSTLFGFPVALIAAAGFWTARGSDDWRPYTFFGVATGLLPLFHVYAFGTVVALAVFWAAFERRPQWLAFFAPALILGLPALAWMWPPSGNRLRWQPFWLADTEGHADGPVWFWLKNTSLFIPLFAAAFFWKRTLHDGLALWLAPIWLWFLVPNFFVFQPWDWDNTKFFMFWWLFGAVAIGAVLARLALSGLNGIVLAGALAIILCLSGTLDVARALDLQASSFVFTDPGGLKVAAWVRENTPTDAVFLTATDHNEHVTSMTGRKVVCGYTGWLFTYGLDDYFVRQRDDYLMLSGQPGSDQLVRQYHVDYVVIGPLERNGDANASDAYWSLHGRQVYSADGYNIYAVNP
jgi:hypothetical protein